MCGNTTDAAKRNEQQADLATVPVTVVQHIFRDIPVSYTHLVGLITTYQIAHSAITASHQDAQGQITAQTHSTEKHYRLCLLYTSRCV